MTLAMPPSAEEPRARGDGPHSTRRADLTAADRAEMYALLDRHFEGVDHEQFARDLDEKDWVLRIRENGELVGFSTLQVSAARLDGRPVHVIYSGDTIMDPAAWRSPVLARSWIALVRRIQSAHPDAPWYWLLLSSGFRTYRLLPVFWREFWPCHDAPTPAWAGALLDTLARARFGDRFNADEGIVRFARPQRLRGALAAVPDGRDADPHIRFFLERNPGHADGDELVCLTALTDANLTAAGERMVGARDR